MGIHDKHRERMRRRFLENCHGFDDHQLLEMLLFYAIPRSDTNPTAHRLIETFGGLKEVLDAPAEKLQQVEGVGERSAMLIKLMQHMAVEYAQPERGGTIIMNTSEEAGSFLWPKFLGKREEVVYMLCLDKKRKFLGCDLVGHGRVDASEVSARKMVQKAFDRNATGIILAHNHPSGVALPSEEDIAVTRELKYILNRMELELLDHLIMTDEDFVSLYDSGVF